MAAHSRRCDALAHLDDTAALRRAANAFKSEVDRRNLPGFAQAVALFGIGVVQLREGDPDAASATFTKSRKISQDCGFIWGEGISEHLLAWGILAGSLKPAATILAVLQTLSRAVDAFERQPNISDALNALYAGAFALAQLGQIDIADRLHTAVLEHASRAGTNTRRYAPPDIVDRIAELLGDHDCKDAEPMGWAAMVTLFTDTAKQLTGEPED